MPEGQLDTLVQPPDTQKERRHFRRWQQFRTADLKITKIRSQYYFEKASDVPIPDKWFTGWQNANAHLPQTTLGISIEAGNAIAQSLLKGEVDGKTVINSQITKEQAFESRSRAIKLHKVNELEGEKKEGEEKKDTIDLSDDRFRRNWVISLARTVGTMLSFIDWYTWTYQKDNPLSERQHAQHDLTLLSDTDADILTAFFTDKKYAPGAKALASLFQELSNAVHSDSGKRLSLAYRSTFDQRNGQETLESIRAKIRRGEADPNSPEGEKRFELTKERGEKLEAVEGYLRQTVTGEGRPLEDTWGSKIRDGLIKMHVPVRNSSILVPTEIRNIFVDNLSFAK